MTAPISIPRCFHLAPAEDVWCQACVLALYTRAFQAEHRLAHAWLRIKALAADMDAELHGET